MNWSNEDIECQINQPLKESGEHYELLNDYLNFEIYDGGVLLDRLPLPVEDFSKFRIYGSTMYIIDSEKDMVIYEYEITGS